MSTTTSEFTLALHFSGSINTTQIYMAARVPLLLRSTRAVAKNIALVPFSGITSVNRTLNCKPSRSYTVTVPNAQNFEEVNCETNNDIDDGADLKVLLGENIEAKCVTCSENIVPGKGPPPEPPVECCMSGCANCVWIAYAEELRDYYSDGGKAALKALEMIENPSLKAFVKLELKLR